MRTSQRPDQGVLCDLAGGREALQPPPVRKRAAALPGHLPARANTLGYFAHDRFEHRDEGGTTDEIALNPKHFNERPPEETLSTLVHELVHLRQHWFGKPGRVVSRGWWKLDEAA